MKSFFIVISCIMLLASCTKTDPVSVSTSSSGQKEWTNTPITETSSTIEKTIAESGDSVAVDYVGRLEDGTIFDSSIKEEAKKSKNYSEWREYSPFKLTLSEDGWAIRGFWKGIMGMKVGEKKTVTIPPEDGYGTDTWISRGEQTVDIKIFDAILERTIPLSETKDIIKMDVDKKVLEKDGELPKVGEILTNDRGVKAKVEAINAEKITLAIDNANNPFKGKKLVKGTQIRYEDGNIGTITKVTDKEVFLRVENKSNPFYGKKLVVGLTGIYEESQRVTITKIEGKNITLKIEEKNPNPLVNKTLIFDLTLRSVTAAKK